MGIDGMRVGGGRCPPLIVAGLIVACFLLVCNWWSLSTENNELLRQIDGLSQQLKLSAEQRDECGIQLDDSRQRNTKMEQDLTDVRMQLGHEKNSEHRLDESLKMCNIELESLRKLEVSRNMTMETARVEKEALEGQLETTKEENKKLQEDLSRVQDDLEKLKALKNADKPAEDALPDSKEFINFARAIVRPTAQKPSPPYLGQVPIGAVEVSPFGQRGTRHYGIPVLPRDPPGAVRQLPRHSVTMLKAAGETVLTNETRNGGNQEEQNDLDAGKNPINLDDQETDADNPEVPEPPEDDQELLEDNRQFETPDVKQNQL